MCLFIGLKSLGQFHLVVIAYTSLFFSPFLYSKAKSYESLITGSYMRTKPAGRIFSRSKNYWSQHNF